MVIGAGTAEGVGGDRSTFSAHGAFSHEDVAGARKILWEELSVHGAVGPSTTARLSGMWFDWTADTVVVW